MKDRRLWVDPKNPLALIRQCELAGVTRSTVYAPRPVAAPNEQESTLMREIDAEYTRHPFYGSRRMTVYLRTIGHQVNRKRIQRLMGILGLAGMAPGPNTSRPSPQHRIYPYLLRGVAVTRPNQVWSTDITYIRLTRGFVYLVAVLDWFSRYVLAWEVSVSLEGAVCRAALEWALKRGRPEIFNTDQGAQFTSEDFTGRLEASGIAISMDGRGRAMDNIFVERLWRTVKYEEVYLNDYEQVTEAVRQLGNYFRFYNQERPHQALGYQTPAAIYFGKRRSPR